MKMIKNKSNYKLICYAGSSKGLNEMHHLKILDDFINKYKNFIQTSSEDFHKMRYFDCNCKYYEDPLSKDNIFHY